MSVVNRPPEKSTYRKAIFLYFLSETCVVGTQKNRLNETVFLRTINASKKIFTTFRS